MDKLLSYTDQYRGDRLVSAQELGQFLFGEFYRGQSQTRMNQLLNLIVPFKNLSLNEERATLHRSDMNLFVKQTALAYELLSNFHYFINGEEQNSLFPHIVDTLSFIIKFPNQLRYGQMFKGVALQALEDFYLSGIQFLEASIGNKKTGFLTINKVENFLYALEKVGLFEGPRTAEDINLFLTDFSARWMDPGSPITPDLSLDKIKNFWSSIEKWWERQRLINEMFAQKDLENISMLEYRAPLPGKGGFMALWSHLLKKVGLHQWSQEQRVIFSKDMSRFSYGELTVSNSNWLLVELFMKPYNLGEPNPFNFKIDRNESQEIYKLASFLAGDPRFNDTGLKAFQEMNNFSTQESSDKEMSFFEGYEYVTFLNSVSNISDQIYYDLPQNCFRDYQDPHNRQVMEVDCFRTYFKKNFLNHFGHLSAISRYWEVL